MTSAESFWSQVSGSELAQGDYLLNCPVPEFPADYGQTEEAEVNVRLVDLIVVTQSCDLMNKKVQLVALCPIWPLNKLQLSDPRFCKTDQLEGIRKGRWEALHMLSSPENPTENQDVRIVDFREIHSLPVRFLERHAESLGPRWRLRSPYLEHFSQAFARFFMRVGLPTAIPPFR